MLPPSKQKTEVKVWSKREEVKKRIDIEAAAKRGNEGGLGVGRDTGGKGIEVEVEEEIAAGAEAEIAAGAEAETAAGVEEETAVGVEAGVAAEAEAGTAVEVEAEIAAGAEAETVAGAEEGGESGGVTAKREEERSAEGVAADLAVGSPQADGVVAEAGRKVSKTEKCSSTVHQMRIQWLEG